MRQLVPVVALAVAAVAVSTEPASGTLLNLLAAVPVAVFAIWAYARRLALVGVALAVVIAVVLAQHRGGLEPLLFEVSLLAFVVGRWAPSLAAAALLGALAVTAPVAVTVVQDEADLGLPTWILGVVFPWFLGRALAHQVELAAELEATRRELAEQAMLEERRQVARDVHDFVGHTLAAVMLQITSARHVLRRDPSGAEEALRSAEEVGRRGMREMRRTVALLRSDDEDGAAAPLPSARELSRLVDDARAGGLAVDLRVRGDVARIPPSVGVALYRIAQEALANAARHAPRAHTAVSVELDEGHVRLVADTSGPSTAGPATEPTRQGYGLIGMRERVTALGGELRAGPTPEGWRLSCLLPLETATQRE